MSKPTMENTAHGQGQCDSGDPAEFDALRQSERRYRSLVLATAATVWTTDSSGGFNSPQGSWQAYTGQSWERHRGWGWSEMLHPDDRERMATAWRAAVEGPGLFYVEGRVWNADCGEYHYCEVHGVPILHDDGTVREWVGTTTDVQQSCLTLETLQHIQFESNDRTKADDASLSVPALRDAHGKITHSRSIWREIAQRKQAEQALRENTHRLRSILDNVVAMVGLVDLEGTLVDVNQRALSVANLQREDVLGLHLADTFWFSYSPEQQAAIRSHIERAASGEVVECEVYPRIASGETIVAYSWFHPLRGADGRVAQVIGSGFDITQQKLIERALRKSEEQLRQWNVDLEKRVGERTAELEAKNSELEAFAHSVSHDLRAPLRGMEGFAVALQQDYEDRLDEEGRQFVQHIVDSARQMDLLINDLLAYSELSRDQLVLEPVSLRNIVTSSLNHIENEIRACDAEVVIQGELPRVVGHAATTGQIVTNLVSNAVKFVASGVRPRVRLSVETRGKMARLWVEDNGIGIASQHREKIFHVFERLHGIETFPGTGIGLAIVSRAAKRMAGRCGVESAPGIGSRFWVELPLHGGGIDAAPGGAPDPHV